MQYLGLVRAVVGRLGISVRGASRALEQNDLLQCGVLGLMGAIDRFDPEQGVRFETFATPRIRGAVLDELRTLDWVPRSARSAARRIETAAREVTQETGRDALESEVARKLELPLEEYRTLLGSATATVPPAHESPGTEGVDTLPADTPNPFERLSDEESKTVLIAAVNQLPQRERTVIALYYYEGLRFEEIGKILHVSESRISQIHSNVLRGLKRRLRGYR
jgi:RNA polymerase sigma factor for flagellar operon FliA